MKAITNRKIIAMLLLLVMLFTIVSGCAAPVTPPAETPPVSDPTEKPEPIIEPAPEKESAEVNAAYLKEIFGIELADKPTEKAFAEALNKVAFIDVTQNAADAELTYQNAVKLMIGAAGFEELVKTFPQTKTDALLKTLNIAGDQYAAGAVSVGFLTAANAQAYTDNAALDAGAANALLMAAANATGRGRNFVGYSDDAAIYGKLVNAFESFILLDNDKLIDIGVELVTNKVTTGYNLVSERFNANFLPSLTLRYGHSSVAHAVQVAGLLNSEGIIAKIQIEPKTSIYQYLPEWGDPGEPSDAYKVEKYSDDLWLAYASEYDLVLEFQNEEQMKAFNDLILDYAKKNTGEDGKALLLDSWWQPLYVAAFDMGEGYTKIFDNVISDGSGYSLHPFSLPEKVEEVAAKIKSIDGSVTVESKPIWCNDAFFRYLNGESE